MENPEDEGDQTAGGEDDLFKGRLQPAFHEQTDQEPMTIVKALK